MARQDDFMEKILARITATITAKNGASQQPVNQHYLPKTYQKRFTSSEGTFYLFNLLTKSLHVSTPGRAGKERDIYTRRDVDGCPDYSIEHFFSVVENDSASAIDRLIAGEGVSDEDRFWISFFWGAAFCRSPDLRLSYSDLFETQMTLDAKRNYSTLERAEESLRTFPSSNLDISAREIAELVNSDGFALKPEPEDTLLAVLRLMPAICQIIWGSQWRICRAPPGKSFVTTDNPVVLIGFRGDMLPDQRDLGFSTSGAVKILPISHEICLMAGPPGTSIDRQVLDRDMVRQLNVRLASEARGLIIAKDRALLESLVKYTGADVRKWAPCFTVTARSS